MFGKSAFGVTFSVLILASGLTAAYALSLTAVKKSTLSCQRTLSANFHTTDLEKSVFVRINRYRVSLGLPKLTLDERITKQARIHSQNMASGRVPFSHQGFPHRVKAIAIPYNSAAENVALNKGYVDPAAEAVNSWLKSQEHLPNIKGNYNLTGIGVAVNDKGEVYITQIFLNQR